MSLLNKLEVVLSNADATMEREMLGHTFVYFDFYNQITNPTKFALLVGKKGSGKSALLAYSEMLHDELGMKSLSLDPSKLLMTGLPSPHKNDSLAVKINHYYHNILYSIAVSIGESTKFSITDDSCLSAARQAGAKGEGISDKILKAISCLQFSGSWIPSLKLPERAKPTISALKRDITNKQNIQIYIDDIDTAGDFNTSEGLDKIYAIIMASRKITGEIPTIKILLSLRYDLWWRLQKQPSGVYEIDKLRNHVVNYVPDDEQISLILQSWLRYAIEIGNDSCYGNPFSKFFIGEAILPDTKRDKRSWPNFITTYSRQRPRDGMRLISLLSQHARTAKLTAINDACINVVMPKYSKERVDDTKNEFSFACKNLIECICTFSEKSGEGRWVYKFEEIEKCVNKAASCGVAIHGIALKHNDLSSQLSMLSFLYEIGFINPKIVNRSNTKGYEFIYHDSSPDFICFANLKHIQKMEWHIHPSYRDYLKTYNDKYVAYKS